MRNYSDRRILEECRKRGYIVLGHKRPIERAIHALKSCDTTDALDILEAELQTDCIAVPSEQNRQMDLTPLLKVMGEIS